MMSHYALLQLSQTAVRERFMSLAWLREQGLQPKPKHYTLVYSGELPQAKKTLYALEELFAKFNVEIPKDFPGHAMSTSDIVAVLTGGTAIKYYYCDSVGFKRLTGFHHPAAEELRLDLLQRGEEATP